jgi:nucleotide-binding universal stress UspA family protein
MKRILILIDGNDNDRASLATAAAAADVLGAHLTVGYAPIAVGNRVVAANAARDAGEAFDEVCGSRGDTEFVAFEGAAPQRLTAVGHGYDLLIIERASSEEGPEIALLNAGLFDTGRPVLLAPPAAQTKFPTWAAVAWNGSPQAASAVSAAVPLLKLAQGVTLLIGSRETDLEIEHVRNFLTGHGIKTETGEFPSDGLTARARGRALLEATQELDADLLITGAYGQAQRSSIFGLGRATQKIATAAPIPVLLSS